MTDIKGIGKRGEAIAARHLEQLGFRILAKNFRRGRAEIDIIAMEGSFLVAVEVKCRSSRFFGEPEAAIDDRKIELISRAIGYFQEQHKIAGEIRFDIVSILFPAGKKPVLKHIREAFRG